MGNSSKKAVNVDAGDTLDSTYAENISFRITLVNSFRLERPVWIESAGYSLLKAYHFKNKKNLVIKKVAITPESTREIFNQLAVHKKLVHLNIRQVEEVFQTKTHYYMSYLFFEGSTFNQYFIESKKPVKVSEIKTFFKELLLTLSFVHGNSIVLRNLEPSNIIFNGKEILLVGLSKARIMAQPKVKGKKKASKVNLKYIANFSPSLYKAPEVIEGKYDQ